MTVDIDRLAEKARREGKDDLVTKLIEWKGLGHINPGPLRGDWIDFLLWLADDKMLDARDIIRCVEKPHNYHHDYEEYLAEGGVDR